MKNRGNITDRKILKNLFSKGRLPTDDHFKKLIDSTFNKVDDKIDIDEEDGLMIYPANKGELLSFFEDIDDESAKWVMLASKNKGLIIQEVKESGKQESKTSSEKENASALFLRQGGNIGIGTNTPSQKLEVKGIVSYQGRIGNYHDGKLAADGNWYNVFEKNLSGCNAYEITAYVQGKKGDGKYSLLHATAVCTHGNSKPKITKTCAHYGKWWNKIDIRWESRPTRVKLGNPQEKPDPKSDTWWSKIKALWEVKDINAYNLQIRTKGDYGNDITILYKVSILWDSNFLAPTTE
ncbi:hypothetical protein [Aquimarina aggregata]|uniref:hypothetical protein n=1 Tax=Aquimarina aggregata TaxID=1642818 RepID=UPI00249056ED|nr:hypothetical protein [Aquimarina aggregata]